ncbi:ABC-type transport system ATP-binding protein (probable substrate iron-III) [Haladaptatus paucihalophilus DX253]|uniref:Cobalamin import ATP-binding protein BtuD n=1 Tax=Haladaptatus paucihalophilus DX253 TaxID=797209 RepID=E7QRV3_HALPU|nr:ATP-binding cassette domain-containing protein [Haladaptatus paucihalophilus]EFW92722.1 ABC-type transport system ATP-binding protein (probable substrate iron-III) [Haladaptatus paucihalophilus DX253]SHK14554.1 iron complex transport system ATP-binding protein [Haladaptatus paucihalophilus DX253]
MIRIEDVSITLGENEVLDGVSASIDEGRFVGLVGPNGAGKTTLLRATNGVLSPDSGRVVVDDDAIADLSSKAASRRVATVPQDTSLSFDFDVRNVVAMGRNPYRTRFGSEIGAKPAGSDGFGGERGTDVVERAMDRTEVSAFADRSITEVSGGERQRVLLARALAQDTPVLLLDEPTASLDINHQVRTFELVRELVADGKTVVAAIHDLNLAAHYCDELLLLADGSVLADGTPTEVLAEETLREAFDTRAVVSRHPVTGSTYVTALPERTAGTDGNGDREDDGSGRVHVIGGGGTVSRLLYLLSAAGHEVSVGVLNEGDSDLETARHLGLETVAEEPFAPIGPEARTAVERRIREADVTVLADVEIGTGNVANLDAAAEAESVVVVEERPFEDRNYAGSEAAVRYRSLRERGTVVSPDDLLSAVADAV